MSANDLGVKNCHTFNVKTESYLNYDGKNLLMDSVSSVDPEAYEIMKSVRNICCIYLFLLY